ncbi:hypothetical protein AUS18_26385 [Escherichia coli]|nr:hypothetical protein [Escherichia coli]EFO0768658.1 hypothetical protein [Escherichia coli]EFO1086400.1 hypothetical protein [Escherichia coli]EGD4796031.1 hypothetical protein [Escherichia coli]EGD4833692.1 hypothetical protein [Escherichia coli]
MAEHLLMFLWDKESQFYNQKKLLSYHRWPFHKLPLAALHKYYYLEVKTPKKEKSQKHIFWT